MDKLNIIVVGMAGSGKTTFVNSLQNHLKNKNQKRSCVLNLDPAVLKLPYEPDIDIRSDYNFKDIMKKFKLGPNGAIMTCLNLYASSFDKVIDKVENSNFENIIIDTPGQIEAFTWSASGDIFTQSLANSMNTVILFVLDSSRCQNPNTFMSNMLYCCSVMYKTKLPIMVIYNKTDIANCDNQIKWMNDYESFIETISQSKNYLSSLSRSLALSLDEFYSNLKYACVSSLKNEGFEDIVNKLPSLIKEYKEYFN